MGELNVAHRTSTQIIELIIPDTAHGHFQDIPIGSEKSSHRTMEDGY